MQETGNPLVVNAACDAGLSGAKRARIILDSLHLISRVHSVSSSAFIGKTLDGGTVV